MATPAPPRLCTANLDALTPGVARFAYDRRAARVGVVHLGPGAFHRAHQAWYFDRLLERDPTWAICGVALKSATIPDTLAPQDGLYALAEVEADPSFRVIGAMTALIAAGRKPTAVLARLADPATRWVGLTITEKGYGLTAAGDLDATNADIAHDLDRELSDIPASAIGWIVAGLELRKAAGAAPFVTASCDNLPGNGERLKRGVLQLAATRGADLAKWIEAEARFPCSMVDSITPAADEALKARVAAAIGLTDAAPVQRERFVQWVIDEDLGPGAPDLASVGVTLTSDIQGYEAAKLKLLNGAHSSLAYLGLLRGHETVAEAVADPVLGPFVLELMTDDIAPLITPPKGMDLRAYIDAILTRFANGAIRHRLIQIAMDGSQKLPIRLLGTIEAALASGRPVERLCRPVAAWMVFVGRETRAGRRLNDPLADRLAAADGVEGLLAIREVFSARLAEDGRFAAAVKAGVAALS